VNLTDLTKEDTQAILDGLAALPLARAYNTFNKVMQQVQAEERLTAPRDPAGISGTQQLASLVPQGTTPS
jgi:hypothetical protein